MNEHAAKYITYPQAEEMLGISARAIQRLVSKGQVAAYRPGKKTMLSVRDLEIWFESTRVKPIARRGRPRRGAKRL